MMTYIHILMTQVKPKAVAMSINQMPGRLCQPDFCHSLMRSSLGKKLSQKNKVDINIRHSVWISSFCSQTPRWVYLYTNVNICKHMHLCTHRMVYTYIHIYAYIQSHMHIYALTISKNYCKAKDNVVLVQQIIITLKL